MVGQHVDPPQRRRLVDTRDVGEARDTIGRIFCPHFLFVGKGGAAQFHARHRSIEAPGYSVNLVSYGAEVDIDPGQLARFYLLQIPLTGGAQVRCGAKTVDVAVGRSGSILSPTLPTRMTWGAGCEKLIVLVGRDMLDRYFESLTHEASDAIVFEPGVDLRSDIGLGLANHARFMLRTVETPHLTDAYRSTLCDGLAALMLQGLSHDHARHLTRPASPAAPAAVRRALDFIDAHAAATIRAADIAQAAGTSLRSLQDAFQRCLGLTLGDAILAKRLERLRADLLRPTRLSVSDTILAAGFGHLGRAAAAYRDRYGESPSETWRRNSLRTG